MLPTQLLDALVVLALVGAGEAYRRAEARVRRTGHADPRSVGRRRSFLTGLVVLWVALETPIDTWTATSFAIHMVQHLLLTMVAAPLLVLGAPIRLALRAWPGAPRRRIVRVLRSRIARLVSDPLVGWATFFGIMWATHLTGVYEATLRSTPIHAAEHAAYLGSALMFWSPVIGVDPSPSRLSHPGRILYLFLAMPAMAFLGLTIYSTRDVLYPAYAAAEGVSRALTDQHVAGALMWTGTMFLIVPALGFVVVDWMHAEEREAAREDARIARASSARRRGGSASAIRPSGVPGIEGGSRP